MRKAKFVDFTEVEIFSRELLTKLELRSWNCSRSLNCVKQDIFDAFYVGFYTEINIAHSLVNLDAKYLTFMCWK